MASVCMTTWLRPSSSVFSAAGNSTFQSNCRRVQPGHSASLDDVRRNRANAEDRAARHGRHGEADRRQHGRNLPEAEEHDDRSQIGHVRRCLHHVEDDVQDALRPGVARCPYAEG